jgi:hypothetical protein
MLHAQLLAQNQPIETLPRKSYLVPRKSYPVPRKLIGQLLP